jgi:arylsulfatase A-like enzyme
VVKIASSYLESTPFSGVVGRTMEESVEAWPISPTAPPGAPNVVIVVLDDVGYAQLGCFGSDIPTPTFDGLAAGGVRFRNFHTTAMCSPSRAALLTGRNPHTTGMGGITETSSGFPGYHARLNKRCGFLSEILRDSGYATWALGKWHLAPGEECHAGSSRARWPLGRGFERFYGFLGPETNQWVPDLVIDNQLVDPPRRDGYHLTEDLVDQGISLLHDLRNVSATKPFFTYLALGACHSPFHVPKQWREKFRGAFDDGWDAWRSASHQRQIDMGLLPPQTALTPRPAWVAPWHDMSADERLLAARSMELFAGFLAHTDHHVGRFIEALRATGDLDNTILVLLSDNGASAEGGKYGAVNANLFYNQIGSSLELNLAHLDRLGDPDTNPHYPMGWALAGNTPFQRWKRETHEGGTTDPFIVHYPRGVAARGEIRQQYTHLVDVLPTILDLCGIEMPQEIDGVAQEPLAGVSFAQALASADAPEHRTTQYYEQFGCRAMYRNGWKAVAYHPLGGLANYSGANPLLPFDEDVWELYHVAEDPSETTDLSDAEPEKLYALIELWFQEATRYGALPLHSFRNPFAPRPGSVEPRDRYVYRPGPSPIPRQAAANVLGRPHTITADCELASASDGGVVIAEGGKFGGYSLYIADGRLRYATTGLELVTTVVSSTVTIPVGRTVKISARMTPNTDGQLDVELLIDGADVGRGVVPPLPRMGFSLAGDGLSIGFDAGTPAGPYEAPFHFTGLLESVVVDVSGVIRLDPVAEIERALRQQ